MLEMKLAVRYGEENAAKNIKLGEGLVGWAALHKEPVLVSDVSKDPRYINLVEDVALRAGDPDADQGSLHRRIRPRKPRAECVHQGTTRSC